MIRPTTMTSFAPTSVGHTRGDSPGTKELTFSMRTLGPPREKSGPLQIVAASTGRDIGFINGSLATGGGAAVINRFFVMEDARGQGVGTSLVRHFIVYAMSHGGSGKIIFQAPSAKAQGIINDLGFVRQRNSNNWELQL